MTHSSYSGADHESRCTVFQRIAQQPYVEWPAYDSTPLYDRTSLAGLESDVRVVSGVWFTHPDHNSLEGLALLKMRYASGIATF